MSAYVLSQSAQRDLRNIRQYVVAEGDRERAHRVLLDLRAALELLAATPGAGHSRTDLTGDLELRFWPVHSYLIVYYPRKPLDVVRVLHGARALEDAL